MRSAHATDLVSLARPRHWIKSVFIALPLPFAVAAGASLHPVAVLLGALGFCLVSSAMYVFNDLCDVAKDAAHPTKRARPLAAGRITRPVAAVWSAALLLAGLLLVASIGIWGAFWIVVSYAGLNVVYSLGAKNVPLVDVFLLAAGFLLRVLLGCALISAEPSRWLLLCASSLALFLAFAKRRADLMASVSDASRPSLAGYTEHFLDQAMTLTGGVVLLSYGLYCQEALHLVKGREFATLPFVAFGLLDYLRVSQLRNEGASPVDLVLASPALLASGVGWAAAVLWSLGYL